MDYDIEKRFKLIEEKIYILYQMMENFQTTNDDRLSSFDRKIQEIINQLDEIKKQVSDLNIKIKSIMDQLSLFALSDRVEYIEKFLDYIDPVNFVTRREVERLVEKKIKEYLGKKNME